MQLLTFAESQTPAGLRAQVLELHAAAWPDPTPPVLTGPTHDPLLSPLSVLLVDDGCVVAALDLLFKALEHDGASFRAGGLSTVVTRADRRLTGLGTRLVRAAHDLLAAEVDLGLFTCDRHLLAFYERAGWSQLPGTVVVGGTRTAPFPSDGPGFDKVVLADFFTADARSHRASFVGSRIGLFPGEIDRLW